MARVSLCLFAITAMLASWLGHAVSLKYSKDRNSLDDSSEMDMWEGGGMQNLPWFKNTGQWQWPANQGAPAVTVAPAAPAAQVKHTVAPQPSKIDPGAMMSQLTVQVNKTLTKITAKVVSLVDSFEQKKTQLLKKVNTTLIVYVNELNSTLLDAEEKVQDALLALQALIDLLVPTTDAPTDSMGPMSRFADALHEAARIAGELHDITYAASQVKLNAINSTLQDGLAAAKAGSSKIEGDIALLADRMIGALHQMPLPDVVFSTVDKMFDMAKETVKSFHTQFDRGATVLVSGVEESSFSELSTVPKSSFVQSGASRVTPLLAAILAVGAVAFQ